MATGQQIRNSLYGAHTLNSSNLTSGRDRHTCNLLVAANIRDIREVIRRPWSTDHQLCEPGRKTSAAGFAKGFDGSARHQEVDRGDTGPAGKRFDLVAHEPAGQRLAHCH